MRTVGRLTATAGARPSQFAAATWTGQSHGLGTVVAVPETGSLTCSARAMAAAISWSSTVPPPATRRMSTAKRGASATRCLDRADDVLVWDPLLDQRPAGPPHPADP